MKKQTVVLFAVLLLLFVAAPVRAQDEIPEPKKKLISELMVLTDAKSQISDVTDSMLESLEKIYPVMVRQTLEGNGMSDDEREQIATIVDDSYKSFSRKFRERLPKAVDYDEYLETQVYPLYAKHFTEQELAELIAFYKTDIGRKIVKTLPVLTRESMELADTYLTPRLMKLVEEIMAEEFPDEDEPPPPPAPKKG